MKYLMKILSALLLVAFVISSCDVTDQTPQQSLPSETVLTSEQGARSTLAGAYSAYQDVIEDDYVFAELAGDYADHSGSYPSWAAVDQHNLLTSNAEARDLWIDYYYLINTVNNLITNVPNIDDSGFSDAEKGQVVAEAKVLRALSYHTLVRWFGNVPLVTDPTVALGDDTFPSRTPVADVYSQIVTDLQDAESTLGANGSPSATNVTGFTAKALLARVYLYQENYEQAAAYATDVISNGPYELGSYEALFGDTPSSNEPIFRLSFTTEDDNNLAFFARPNGFGGRREYAPNNTYVNVFSEEDSRAGSNLKDFDGDGAFELGKYFTLEGNDDVHVVRLAEMYLIRAEARGMGPSSDYAGAAEDLNHIQRRAYGDDPATPQPTYDYTVAEINSDQTLMDAVMYQRGLELAQEGHRWYDLTRTGRAVSDLDIEPEMTLWPIPERDINANPELEQNPGY